MSGEGFFVSAQTEPFLWRAERTGSKTSLLDVFLMKSEVSGAKTQFCSAGNMRLKGEQERLSG
jgi:hypothetical protein